MTDDQDWERRVADLWAAIDGYERDDFIAKVDALAGERPTGDALAAFELGSANDSMGYPERAAPLYRRALAAGLTGLRRRRAVIQLASTLRNLGQATESVVLLTGERAVVSDGLDDAVAATLALALVDVGREREAVSVALTALSRHLKRYNRSMANYAKALIEDRA